MNYTGQVEYLGHVIPPWAEQETPETASVTKKIISGWNLLAQVFNIFKGIVPEMERLLTKNQVRMGYIQLNVTVCRTTSKKEEKTGLCP